jgi:hypothetical protein
MVKGKGKRKKMPEGRFPAWPAYRPFLLPVALVLLLAGCASEDRPASDPLVGGPPARSATGRSPQAAAGALAGPTPPLPAPSSSTSPAALAPGAFQPLDPNRELRIGNGDTGSGTARTTSTGNNWKGQNAQPGVTLNRPEPTTPETPPLRPEPKPEARAAAPSGGVTLAGGSRLMNYEQAEAVLTGKGVTWQRLETWGDAGEWKFSCSIPNRNNPNIRRTYEARAHDSLGALRAVLDQIDRDQR